MSVAFKAPFIAEILGSGFDKAANETFEMLRHPRIKKIHHDRTWEDAVSMDDLVRMADEKWEMPDSRDLDGHARDVAVLVKKYLEENKTSQSTTSEYETTQETTQRSEVSEAQSTSSASKSAIVQETQQATYQTSTTATSSQCSGSTQGTGTRASRELRSIPIREDTSEHLFAQAQSTAYPTPPTSSGVSTASKRSFEPVSPPCRKRRKALTALANARGHNLGGYDYDSQEKIIRIYAGEGMRVQVHGSSDMEE